MSAVKFLMLVAAALSCCCCVFAAPAPALSTAIAAGREAPAPDLELLEYLGGLTTHGSQWLGPEDMAIEELDAQLPSVAVAHGTRAKTVSEKTPQPSSEVQDNDE